MGVPCREGESLVLLSPVVRVSAASFVLQKEGRKEGGMSVESNGDICLPRGQTESELVGQDRFASVNWYFIKPD